MTSARGAALLYTNGQNIYQLDEFIVTLAAELADRA